jgi:hypothetical protein
MLKDMKIDAEHGAVVLENKKETVPEPSDAEDNEDDRAYEECEPEDHEVTSNLLREQREQQAFEAMKK